MSGINPEVLYGRLSIRIDTMQDQIKRLQEDNTQLHQEITSLKDQLQIYRSGIGLHTASSQSIPASPSPATLGLVRYIQAKERALKETLRAVFVKAFDDGLSVAPAPVADRVLQDYRVNIEEHARYANEDVKEVTARLRSFLRNVGKGFNRKSKTRQDREDQPPTKKLCTPPSSSSSLVTPLALPSVSLRSSPLLTPSKPLSSLTPSSSTASLVPPAVSLDSLSSLAPLPSSSVILPSQMLSSSSSSSDSSSPNHRIIDFEFTIEQKSFQAPAKPKTEEGDLEIRPTAPLGGAGCLLCTCQGPQSLSQIEQGQKY